MAIIEFAESWPLWTVWANHRATMEWDSIVRESFFYAHGRIPTADKLQFYADRYAATFSVGYVY